MRTKLLSLFLCFASLVGAVPAAAFETDQYNLPPEPLADIAPEFEAYVAEHIQDALDKLNREIAQREACVGSPHVSKGQPGERQADTTRKCASPEKERAALDQLRSPDAVTKAVYRQLGTGSIFLTNTGKWLENHKFEHGPSRYKPDYTDSIYWSYPINYATLSPTIRMYGVEFGTDKLDHFFQQGYKYLQIYQKELAKGRTDAEALKKAVSWGRSTENLWFGYLVSGVYSNADLAANFGGMWFYRELTEDVPFDSQMMPAMLKLVDGRWQFARTRASLPATVDAASAVTPGNGFLAATRVPAGVLAPFISDHLNEAYNPSNYLFFLYPIVKNMVKNHDCEAWRTNFPQATRAQLKARTTALQTWHGLDYGYKQTSRQVRIAEVCFADLSQAGG